VGPFCPTSCADSTDCLSAFTCRSNGQCGNCDTARDCLRIYSCVNNICQ
jgi:hypothetical protein